MNRNFLFGIFYCILWKKNLWSLWYQPSQ